MINLQTSSRFRSHGFTMVEVLVALVVLSVGMLGIAGLYVYSLQASGTAIYRTQAVSLAADIADRMRSNRNAAASYAGTAATSLTCTGSVATADCSASAMAADDLLQWTTEISSTLPSGQGAVAVVSAGTPATYQITVSWMESGTTARRNASTYVMTVQL